MPSGFTGGLFKRNSGVCVINCSAAGTSIELHFLLQKVLHAVGTNKLTTAKQTNAVGKLIASPEKWQKFIWEKVRWKHLAQLQIKKANLRTHLEQNTNPLAKAFPRLRKGVSEGNNNKSFFSGKERRHSIRKNNSIMATKTVMDTDMVNINQKTLFIKVEFLCVVPAKDLKHIDPYKKFILCKKNSKCAVSKKVKKRYRELEISDKRHGNSVFSRGSYNAISPKNRRTSQILPN